MNPPTPIDTHRSTPSGDQGSGPIIAPMVAALEAAWAAICERHPEVPAAVIVLGAGSIGTAGGLRLGHFAAMRWYPDHANSAGEAAGDRLPEVFVGGEGSPAGQPTCSARCCTRPLTRWPTCAGSKTPPARGAGTTPGSRPWPRNSGYRCLSAVTACTSTRPR